jgi:hypothetical protein
MLSSHAFLDMNTISTPSLICLIGAYSCLIFGWASYVYRHREARILGRLKLKRLVEKGEQLVCSLVLAKQPTGDSGKLRGLVVALMEWRRECLQMIKDTRPCLWDHFSDLGEFLPGTIEEQTHQIIKRINDLPN